jgi:hypothetical protein
MVGSVASQIGKPAFPKFIDSGGNPLKNLAMRSSRGEEAPASDGSPWAGTRHIQAEVLIRTNPGRFAGLGVAIVEVGKGREKAQKAQENLGAAAGFLSNTQQGLLLKLRGSTSSASTAN